MFGGWIILGLAGWNHFFWWLNPMFDLWNPISMAKSCYIPVNDNWITLFGDEPFPGWTGYSKSCQIRLAKSKCFTVWIQIYCWWVGITIYVGIPIYGLYPHHKTLSTIPSTKHYLGNSMSIKRPIHGPTMSYLCVHVNPKSEKKNVLSWRCEYLVEWRDRYPLVN